MDRTKWIAIIGVVLIIVGALMGTFVDFDGEDMAAIATICVGTVIGLVGIIKKSTAKKDGWWWATFGFIVGGSILCAIAGITENVILGVIAAVIVVAGVLKGIIFK